MKWGAEMAMPTPGNKPSLDSAIVREMAEAYEADSFDGAIDILAQQVRNMIGAHQSAVSYFPGGSFTNAVHALSFSEKYEKYNTYDVMPTGEGIWAVCLEREVRFCMTDDQLKSHSRWRNFSGLKDDRGLEHPPMRGWLAVPISSKTGKWVSLFQLTDRFEGDFTEEDLELLTEVAKLSAPTFELQYVNQELQRRKVQLEEKTAELERFNKLAVGREQRMIELKRQVNDLAKLAGKEPPYDLSFADGSMNNDPAQ